MNPQYLAAFAAMNPFALQQMQQAFAQQQAQAQLAAMLAPRPAALPAQAPNPFAAFMQPQQPPNPFAAFMQPAQAPNPFAALMQQQPNPFAAFMQPQQAPAIALQQQAQLQALQALQQQAQLQQAVAALTGAGAMGLPAPGTMPLGQQPAANPLAALGGATLEQLHPAVIAQLNPQQFQQVAGGQQLGQQPGAPAMGI